MGVLNQYHLLTIVNIYTNFRYGCLYVGSTFSLGTNGIYRCEYYGLGFFSQWLNDRRFVFSYKRIFAYFFMYCVKYETVSSNMYISRVLQQYFLNSRAVQRIKSVEVIGH